MKKLSLTFLFPLLALIGLTIVLSRKIFSVPPLGIFLNPFTGVIQNEKENSFDKNLNYGREKTTEIFFDNRNVPHVFSQSDKDLFFAQGYVTASDRLWQMDFLSYVAAGRLCEILGHGLLDYDRAQRRSGILAAAINSLKLIESDPLTKLALDNYTEGVNKYISSVGNADLPMEYKLLDYKPEPWTNLKSALIMKYMGALLSGYEDDIASSYLYAALGKKEYDKLFSNYFINNNKDHFSVHLLRDTQSVEPYLDFSFLESSPLVSKSNFNPRLGSNSWAIRPGKSTTGSAMLCNDPHLNLSFPAVWYELQLQSDKMNVYGYSIPGTPGVIIGYNKAISWGLTNGSTDVCNFFKLELKEDYSQYKLDGAWKKTKLTVEKILVKDDVPFYDTVYYSIHGPITADHKFGLKEKTGLAMNWTLHDSSNEFLAFLKLNKATGYSEFKEAISHYKCPVQNFTYADVNGNIASHLQGKIYKSYRSAQGKFILDGTRSEYLDSAVLSSAELPSTFNPPEGFVCAANNNPFYKEDSFYVHGHYSELRAGKIKQFLSSSGKLNVENLKSMQLDNTNYLAEIAVPVLTDFISENNQPVKKFREWNYKCTKESESALLFERWWALIKENTWDELKRYPKSQKFPDDLILLDLITNDPGNKYFDKLSTERVETAGDIVRMSMNDLVQSWQVLPTKWENYNQVSIMHLSNISALSRKKIYAAGHPNAINALSSNWGPSLRFIVIMDSIPRGYGIYAGGQSGNPASVRYDQFVNDWINGAYYELNFFPDKKTAQAELKNKWIIK